MKSSAVNQSVAWSFLESAGVSLTLVCSTIVVARLLDPETYGIASLVLGIVFVLNLCTERFFHDVLVQSPDIDDTHFNTAFCVTVLAATIITGLCYGFAAKIAEVFAVPDIELLLKWTSLSLVFNAFGATITAHLRRSMKFKAIAIRNLIATAAGAVSAIVLALSGWGAFSLVVQQLVFSVIGVVLLFILTDKWPRITFSHDALKQLAGYSLKATSSALVMNATGRVFFVLVGYRFGPATAGYLDIAWRMVDSLRFLVGNTINPLVLTIFAKAQENHTAFKAAFLRAIEINAFIMFPLFCGISLTAEYFVQVVLGDAWIGSVPIVQVVSIGGMFAILAQLFMIGFSAVGRPATSALVAIAGFVFANSVIMFVDPSNLNVGLVWLGRSGFMLLVGFFLASRLFGISMIDVAHALKETLIALAIMTGCLWYLEGAALQNLDSLTTLLIVVPVGVCIYGICQMVLFPKSAREYAGAVKELVSSL